MRLHRAALRQRAAAQAVARLVRGGALALRGKHAFHRHRNLLLCCFYMHARVNALHQLPQRRLVVVCQAAHGAQPAQHIVRQRLVQEIAQE
jgi:hypothetical protein